jgi:DNA-binding phage protein
MTELLLSWKDVQTRQTIVDFVTAVMEEGNPALCRQRSASPSPPWH